jgi:hypothetical protein
MSSPRRRLWDGAARIRDRLRSYGAQARVAWRWRFSPKARPHQLPGKLIVSLTSYPPRFGTLACTLKSLLRQTVKPDHTILWIAHSDFALLPKSVTDLQSAGLEIRRTDDLKSYKKIIPALDAFPEAFICTADDDTYYWPTWLEELTRESATKNRHVICHRASEITYDHDGKYKPFAQWIWGMHARERKTSRGLVPTGVGGVLYPPGILAHTAADRAAFRTLCPNGDDLWLYWMGRKNGAIYTSLGSKRRSHPMAGVPGPEPVEVQPRRRRKRCPNSKTGRALRLSRLPG